MGRDDVKLGEERELIAMDGEKLLDIYLPGEGFMPEAPMWSLRPPQHVRHTIMHKLQLPKDS